jgi:hypothetical protein
VIARPMSLLALSIGIFMIAGPIVSTPISAHHGTAVYDTAKLTTLKGTVTNYQFMNPHSIILLDVRDDAGKVANWVLEAGSGTSMSRKGWSRNLLKPGDQITAVGNRAKNGSSTMRLSKIALSNGKEYFVDRGEDYAN